MRPPLALLVAAGLALAGCGAAGGGGGGTHVGAGRPAAGHAAAGPVDMPVVTPAVRPLEIAGAPPAPGSVTGSGAAAPVRVRIPAIGVDSGLARLGLNPDGTIQVPPDSGEAGWYANGPAPGQPGPAVILGHLDSYTGPAVFYRLSALKPGDELRIGRDDGSELRFTVVRLATFPVDGFPTSEVYGVTSEPALRLITCSGSFDLAQRRYQSNVVVFAALAV